MQLRQKKTSGIFLGLFLCGWVVILGDFSSGRRVHAFQLTDTLQKTEKPTDNWWNESVDDALSMAGDNRGELIKALTNIPKDQRPAMAFLVENMPDSDLVSLSAVFLMEHVSLAYEARDKSPWGKTIPDELFFNDVVAYANVNEKRERWRKSLSEKCWPIVKDCKTPAEAAQKINENLFKLVNVKYSTKRKKPDQAPSESIEQGLASCTGLSILLSDACRSVCVPARLAGTPLWTNKRGNHTWVEIWDEKWHFTGACEPDKRGLNHGWFVADAAQADKDSRLNSIYAASFKKTETYFPLVWDRRNVSVPAINVSEYYNALAEPKTKVHRLMIRLLDEDGKTRVARKIIATHSASKKVLSGISKDESADTNDFLTFEVGFDQEWVIQVDGTDLSKTVATGKKSQSITQLQLNSK